MVLRVKLFNLKLFCEQEKQRVLDDLFGISRVMEFYDRDKWRVTKKAKNGYDEWRFWEMARGKGAVPACAIRINSNGSVRSHTKEQVLSEDRFYFYHLAHRLKYLHLKQEVKKIIPWLKIEGFAVFFAFNKKGYWQLEVRGKYGLAKMRIDSDSARKMKLAMSSIESFLRMGNINILKRQLRRYKLVPDKSKLSSRGRPIKYIKANL